jgi:hypothetical protein
MAVGGRASRGGGREERGLEGGRAPIGIRKLHQTSQEQASPLGQPHTNARPAVQSHSYNPHPPEGRQKWLQFFLNRSSMVSRKYFNE